MKLLLQQQPVAKDLREISSALKMISDLERIGDQAADIAELTRFARVPEGSGRVHIGEMARAVIRMVTDSVDSFVKGELDWPGRSAPRTTGWTNCSIRSKRS